MMREAISLDVMFARPVKNIKIERLYRSDPKAFYALRVLKLSEPCQAGMVSHNFIGSADQVILELLHSCNNRQ